MVFKIGTNSKDLKLIPEDDEEGSDCVLRINESVENIYIQIFNIENDKEIFICHKELPIFEVYDSFSAPNYTEKQLPPTYLIIPFETDPDTNSYKEIELKFDLKLSFEMRMKILEKLMEKKK